MATTKKTATVKEEVKAAKTTATVKPEIKAAVKAAVKTEEKPAVKAEVKAEAKPAAKAPVKKAEVKAEAKPAAKKAPAKKAATAAKATAAAKETITVQFGDKSYTTEDLVKIAKDVWKYDLKQKAGDFKSVALYVKPEESLVYYVINDEVTGNFAI